MRIRTLHERFLRHIWSRQFVQQTALQTTDGREVQVVAVGMLNTGGGPDFRDAVIRIGGITYSGDVEVHRTLVEWLRHHHESDPRYNNVILHVVLEDPPELLITMAPSGRAIPLLILETFLSESINCIWEKAILAERMRARQNLPCHDRNSSIGADVLNRWIHHLSTQRLELKLRRFDERLRELAQIHLLTVHDRGAGLSQWRIQGDPDEAPPPHRDLTPQQLSKRELWDQVLYEGFMDALGYSRNREPFVRLARAMTLRKIHDLGVQEHEEWLQAALFGAAGLLPAIRSVADKSSRDFVRTLSKIWKERRSRYNATVLHAGDWQLFPTRPSNFPTVRMSAASALIRKILDEDLFRALIEAMKSSGDPEASLRHVRSLFLIIPHPFWTTHYTFGEPTTGHVHPLGPERRDEMIINTVVPLTLLYARIFKDRLARERTLGMFNIIPSTSSNSVIQLMQRQLVHGKLPEGQAGIQQGLLHLYKFYCCEELCAECEIGEIVFQRGN
jgi:hypothetical protein